MTYTKTGCNYTSDCYSEYGLVCNSGSTCNCPENSFVGMCDCYRSQSIEYFWNGTSCQLAYSYGLTCTNSSTTYMCKYMKEGTSCVQSSPGVYTCECPLLQYFNPDGYCTNQTFVNTNCSATSNGTSWSNYTCQTITQLTYCDSVTKTCGCGLNGGFNSTLNKCVFCNPGLYFFNNKCFFFNSSTGSPSSCPSLAEIKDNQTLNYFKSILPNGTYWVGFTRTTSSSCSSNPNIVKTDFTTSDLTFNLGNTLINWCPYTSGLPLSVRGSGNNCPDFVYYDRTKDCFYNDYSYSAHKYICMTSAV